MSKYHCQVSSHRLSNHIGMWTICQTPFRTHVHAHIWHLSREPQESALRLIDEPSHDPPAGHTTVSQSSAERSRASNTGHKLKSQGITDDRKTGPMTGKLDQTPFLFQHDKGRNGYAHLKCALKRKLSCAVSSSGSATEQISKSLIRNVLRTTIIAVP